MNNSMVPSQEDFPFSSFLQNDFFILIIKAPPMNFKKGLFVLSSFLFYSFISYAQIYPVDSIISLINAPLNNDSASLISNSNFANNISRNYPDIAEKLANKSLRIAKKNDDKFNIAKALTVLGNIGWAKGNLDESLIRYFEIKEIAEGIQDTSLLGVVYMNLANIYDDLYAFRNDSIAKNTAMNYAFKAREIYLTRDNRVELSKINNNIGTMYSLRSKYDSAIHFLNKALEVRVILKDSIKLSSTLNNIGLVHKRKKEYPEALSYFYQAETLSKSVNDHNGLVMTGINIGNILTDQKKYSEAFVAYQSSLTHAKAINSNKWISGIYGQIFGLEYKRGNYEEAMEYQELYYREREKIIENSKGLEIKSIESKHALNTKQIELERITSELELTKAKEKNQLIIRNSLIAGILLIGIFGFILFRNQKQKSEREKQYQIAKRGLTQLELENSKLKEQELEKELEYKNKELTSYTMNFIQKNQILEDLKAMTTNVINVNKNDDISKQLRRIKQVIVQNQSQEKDWEDFRLFFESVHKNFFTNLKENHPELTSSDLKLSALIRLNMNLKEAANVFGVEPTSIKTARYRLKKKLNLDQQDDLQGFLMKVES